MKNVLVKIISMTLLCAVLLGFAACKDIHGPSAGSGESPKNSELNKDPVTGELKLSNSVDLMDGVVGGEVNSRETDDRFIRSQAEFGLRLFKESIDDDENSLVSPLSVMLALAMTANGADGETLAEMETLLGGDIPLEELNEYLYTYIKSLPSSEKARLEIANSIWFKDDKAAITVKDEFLKKNADYYGASIYKAPFDGTTAEDINNWVKYNTDGMIDKLLEDIPADAVMYLINAVCFDAEWSSPYSDRAVVDDIFYGLSGTTVVDMMYSEENLFVSDENARGFIKYYKNGYSFMAVLPNEGVSLADYIDTLEGDDLLQLYKNAESVTVNATLPKFKYEYTVGLMDALKALGMESAFGGGFSEMGESAYGELAIGSVIHKTFIEVDNMGTKAAAVSAVEMAPESAPPTRTEKVVLDRPFLYAIVDNATGLPVFIGTVNDIG